MNEYDRVIWKVIAVIVLVTVSIIALVMWGMPKYSIYSRTLKGKSQLKEAEWNKQILIEDARAKKDSAILLAEAEVERARGVAKANKIIGDSLKNNESYLRYLWINGLHDGSSEVIYIATEAGLPILEAGRSMNSRPVVKPNSEGVR